jgi:cytidyltransferase-like protein
MHFQCQVGDDAAVAHRSVAINATKKRSFGLSRKSSPLNFGDRKAFWNRQIRFVYYIHTSIAQLEMIPTEIPILEITILLLCIRIVAPIVANFSMEAVLQAISESSALAVLAGAVRTSLQWIGVSVDRLPSAEVIAFSVFICLCSFLGSVYHWRRRKQLKRELRMAQAKLNYLQEKLRRPPTDILSGEKKEIRIFMDGAFDLLHFGHMNAFRLARSLGTHLVVGVNSDESITQCKGAPLMSDHERLTMVSACKFVDEVIPGCPYIMSSEYLNWAIEKYKIDYVIHGDDPCIVDGKDVYAAAKEAGKFRTIPRTCGVSTTDIVGRMLLLTKDHHYHHEHENSNGDASLEMNGDGDEPSSSSTKLGRSSSLQLVVGQQSKFLTTSRMLQLFSAGVKAPTKDMRVIYIDGAWDLFHPGHVATLKAAREVCCYFVCWPKVTPALLFSRQRRLTTIVSISCVPERGLSDRWHS